jgi:hypothetical protein
MMTEWDPAKARLNSRKHGVSARSLFGRGRALGNDGLDALGRVLVVIYTWRGESVRLVSARKAMPRERRRYEEANET